MIKTKTYSSVKCKIRSQKQGNNQKCRLYFEKTISFDGLWHFARVDFQASGRKTWRGTTRRSERCRRRYRASLVLTPFWLDTAWKQISVAWRWQSSFQYYWLYFCLSLPEHQSSSNNFTHDFTMKVHKCLMEQHGEFPLSPFLLFHFASLILSLVSLSTMFLWLRFSSKVHKTAAGWGVWWFYLFLLDLARRPKEPDVL